APCQIATPQPRSSSSESSARWASSRVFDLAVDRSDQLAEPLVVRLGERVVEPLAGDAIGLVEGRLRQDRGVRQPGRWFGLVGWYPCRGGRRVAGPASGLGAGSVR